MKQYLDDAGDEELPKSAKRGLLDSIGCDGEQPKSCLFLKQYEEASDGGALKLYELGDRPTARERSLQRSCPARC